MSCTKILPAVETPPSTGNSNLLMYLGLAGLALGAVLFSRKGK